MTEIPDPHVTRRRLLAGGVATGVAGAALLTNESVRGLLAVDGTATLPRTVPVAEQQRLPGRTPGNKAVRLVSAHPEPLTPYRDALPVPKVLKPERQRGGRPAELTVPMRVAKHRLHSQLGQTTIWGFDGTVPGPTIEVRADEPAVIRWVNALNGRIPLRAAAPMIAWADPPLWDRPGTDGAPLLTDVSNLPPWTVVHLHGAETGMDNDGWPEAGFPPGQAQVAEYANDQRATALWYHDHAMPISRWNTIVGLSGLYLIRDSTEDRLGLPSGKYEIPLLLCDRNFDLDGAGKLTPFQLYKTVMYATEPELLATSFSGPFTTVNGVIWPHLDVEPRWYRFRVANVSNVRPYHLQLTLEDGTAVPESAIKLIGTDGGLLAAPVDAGTVSVLAAERADILIDFSAFRGRKLILKNADYDPGPWPQVMQFRVGNGRAGGYTPPAKLDTKLPKPGTASATRMIMFPPLGTGQIEQWEMEETEAPAGPFPVDGIVQVKGPDGGVKTYRRVARGFHDPARFMVRTGDWEDWTWINLDVGGWPHPQHVHATHFTVKHRHHYDVAEKWEFIVDDAGRTVGGGTIAPIEYRETLPPAASDAGWKDVVSVNNGEAVTVTAHFAHSGRFLHHCHMRDHEDMGMMRPFVVMPAEVLKIEHQAGHPMENPGHSGH
ncbi:FtsP/CotA-like multicopper oxidase with cupredoxin domain [Catenuloplanes nepalensis]|uniref:Multicopper oxidase CueO n=1 Tax=Catenuloplanes nepalensis TaxID=587533 RepID=A0ABT9MVJ4_9ACTN|nr:multicopper oxidase domain-containing protein [Catenuloplanes nepalensis]MDP9795021.1 FtsP/CotA-like multicopper oxidase with cupredoxin domain [Catenuloplanes nepalensis]